jgi:RNA polymerase sigma-70 factor (ECF subfamily)
MPPMPTWYDGRDACRVFLEKFAFANVWSGTAFVEGERTVRLVVTSANGQPALAAYRLVEGRFVPYALQVLTLRPDAKIADITGFVTPDAFPHFGLPETLSRDDR